MHVDHGRPAIFNPFHLTAHVKQLLKFCNVSKNVIDAVRDREFAHRAVIVLSAVVISSFDDLRDKRSVALNE